ncbi:hypothetical protein [Pseudomonas antarctica]|nr:hypothetical protein [Pseudomonas antarctica]
MREDVLMVDHFTAILPLTTGCLNRTVFLDALAWLLLADFCQ